MRNFSAAFFLTASLSALATGATAQQVPGAGQTSPSPAKPSVTPSDDGNAEEPDIIVTGQRNLPGAVIGDIPPEQQLGPADIRSYGVSSVADLLAELSPQTTSGRGSGGAPVVLLNGRRISSFTEIRDLPTEAIQRVDILPEEVALKYGYRADQKVVNFVLRRRFRAVTAEANDTLATDGGRNTPQGQLDMLNIQRDRRLNLHAEYQESPALTEAQRDIAPVVSTSIDGTDQRPYRTLLASSRDLKLNSVYARTIFGNVAATINGTLDVTDGVGTFGLPTAQLTVPTGSPFASGIVTRTFSDGFLPLSQRSSTITSHLGTTLNGAIGKWNWNLTGNYDRIDSETFTDTGIDTGAFQARLNANDRTADPRGALRAGDFGVLPGTRAFSTSNVAGADALFTGTVFSLPAGPITTSIRIGGSTSDFDSDSYRNGLTQTGRVTRDIVNGQANLDVPIASKSKGVLGFLGTLSANFNLAEDHLSDFGTLTTLGYGANWSPLEGVRIIASHTDQDEAPTAQQLGNPTITTPNTRVFDYIQGTTATVTSISGGNPTLVAQSNHVTKIGLTLKPWAARDLTLTANYVSSRTENPIASFPTATAAIEAAFPDRFTRDAAGMLTQIDSRPINFAESDRSELRWGLNFSQPLKSKIQKAFEAFRAGTGPNPLAGLNIPGFPGGRPGAGADGARPAGDAGGPGGPGGPRGPGGGPGGPGGGRGGFGGGGGAFGARAQAGGRLQFAVYHTWHFTDRVTVANGGSRLNLLNGDAIGASGGQARHEIEGQAGYINNGLGARLSVNYATGTRVDGGTTAAPETLNFSGLATANLRLFGDFGQRLDLLKAHPWLRGTRVTFSITNILNSRQRVTDATGTTPVSYQPDYLDPLGRTVRLSIRKLFF